MMILHNALAGKASYDSMKLNPKNFKEHEWQQASFGERLLFF